MNEVENHRLQETLASRLVTRALDSAVSRLGLSLPAGQSNELSLRCCTGPADRLGQLVAAAERVQAVSGAAVAVVFLAQCTATLPDDAGLAWLLCRALFALGAPRTEEQVLSFERRFGPTLESLVLLGRVLLTRGSAGPALEAFDAALLRAPGDVEAMFGRGKALLAMGKASAAVDVLAAASCQKLGDDDVAFHLALAQSASGKTECAIAVLQSLLARRPDHAEGQFQLGLALQDLGSHDDAERAFAAALHLRPGWAEASFNRGISLLELRELSSALAAFAAALAWNPACAAPVAQAMTSGAMGRLWLDPAAMLGDLSALHLGPGGAEAPAIDAGLS
jgi:tetratricopeptide (TPR) repeat protein